jgi:hypothetical protein
MDWAMAFHCVIEKWTRGRLPSVMESGVRLRALARPPPRKKEQEKENGAQPIRSSSCAP